MAGQLDVRRAIAMAIDRDAVIRYVMGEAARPASALLPPDHWAGNLDLTPIQYDPDKARELLNKAGFNSEHPLRITYKTSTNAFRVRLATVLQSQLKQVGIEVDLRGAIDDAIGMVGVGVEYKLFDLEATRRENEMFREMLREDNI